MIDWKLALGVLSVFIALCGFIPYFFGIFRGSIWPHMFSWLAWGVTSGVGAYTQYHAGAGSACWAPAINCVLCLSVATVATVHGERRIKRIDWFCFFISMATVPFWVMAQSPLSAALLVTFIYVCGFIPTIRKAWNAPSQEEPITFILMAIQYLIVVTTLESRNPMMLIYPSSALAVNALFVAILLYRRSRLGQVILRADLRLRPVWTRPPV